MRNNVQSADVIVQLRHPYVDYTHDQKTAAIAQYQANDGNLKLTAAQLDLPVNTLRYWVESGIQLRPLKQLDLTSKLDKLAHQCADLLPAKLPEATVREIVGAMGQSIQLSQLLKGLPTSITESVDRQELTVILEQAMTIDVE